MTDADRAACRTALPITMIPPTIPELVARAADHPFLGEHLAMGTGARRALAIARHGSLELCSAYEPIYDVSVHGLEQSLSSEPASAARFGDELGFQALTLCAGASRPEN